jgi:hypothetical protein
VPHNLALSLRNFVLFVERGPMARRGPQLAPRGCPPPAAPRRALTARVPPVHERTALPQGNRDTCEFAKDSEDLLPIVAGMWPPALQNPGRVLESPAGEDERTTGRGYHRITAFCVMSPLTCV